MDLRIVGNNHKFKCRVNGILIHEDKILAVKICNNDFYCCPGGHIHLNEDSKSAIEREFYEETGIRVKESKLFCIMENFFNIKGKNIHEIGFYYLLTGEDLMDKVNDFTLVEDDEGVMKNLEFRWFDLNNLENCNFEPVVVIDKLKNKNFEFEHMINHE